MGGGGSPGGTPSGSGGGGGLPGGGGPPGGGAPALQPAPQAAAAIPAQPGGDVKLMGSLPELFNGDRSKAENFIEGMKQYFHLNHASNQIQSFKTKIALILNQMDGKANMIHG